MSLELGTVIAFVATGTFTTCLAWWLGFQRAWAEGHGVGCSQAIRDVVKEKTEAAGEGRHVLSVAEYERHCMSTWTFGGKMHHTLGGWTHLSSKLAGEAGEFSEHWGKALRDDEGTFEAFAKGKLQLAPARRAALIKELGDITWYVAMLAHEMGSSFYEVLMANVEKTTSRKARGVITGDGDNR